VALLQEHKEFGGIPYTCTKWPALTAQAALFRYTKAIGRPVLALLTGAAHTDNPMLVVELVVDEIVNSALSEAEMKDLLLRVMSTVTSNDKVAHLGSEERYNEHFADATGVLRSLEVMRWAFGVQFGTFIGALRFPPAT
jgi:hypothetical protein